eukprot:scaffold5542_cov79-Skeletonema_marinoi.AAC.2
MAWLAMVEFLEGGRKSFVQCDRARHSGHLNFFPPQRSKNLAEKSAANKAKIRAGRVVYIAKTDATSPYYLPDGSIKERPSTQYIVSITSPALLDLLEQGGSSSRQLKFYWGSTNLRPK